MDEVTIKATDLLYGLFQANVSFILTSTFNPLDLSFLSFTSFFLLSWHAGVMK